MNFPPATGYTGPMLRFALALWSTLGARPDASTEDVPFDPSGVYVGPIGTLTVLGSADGGVHYAYRAALPQEAGTCRSVGVLAVVGDGWADPVQHVRAVFLGGTATMSAYSSTGPAGCDRGWPGEALRRRRGPAACTVKADGTLLRPWTSTGLAADGYALVAGARVEAVPGPEVDAQALVLARPVGDPAHTGLVSAGALRCPIGGP